MQLVKLCAVASVPFVGFGFADNFIMIVAGDAIDQSLGVAFGISTLAAAGLGNLLSDVIGLGAGDVIEGWCKKVGINEPPLTQAQLASKQVRRARNLASVLGISVGCLIGMVPLLFMKDRKKLYFTEKELSLYESFFQPFGVTPPDFFELMQHSRWRRAEAGQTMVPAGKIMDRVILLHTGSASAFTSGGGPGASPLKLYNYRGRGDAEGAAGGAAVGDERIVVQLPEGPTMVVNDSASESVRGSIIGGSALVDITVLGLPYPNTVVATRPCEYVEWRIEELREQMKGNKAVEAAVFSTLYLDLVEGLKLKGTGEKGEDGSGAVDDRSAAMNEFTILMRAVMSDGLIHSSERQMVREFMVHHSLGQSELKRHIEHNGWTWQEWQLGTKKNYDVAASKELEERIKEIPALMRSSGIRSRINKPRDEPAEPPTLKK